MNRPDPLIIGLTGQAGAGKDTVATYLCERYGFVADAFAEPIRDMATVLLNGIGIDYACLFERDLKERVIPELGISGRRLMQTLGTEWARNTVGLDFWIKHASLRLGLDNLPVSTPVHDLIVLTDVRFPNEAQWIKSLGGLLVRVNRSTAPVAFHESEQHIAGLLCDRTLHNTGTVEDLQRQIDAEFFSLLF